MGIDWDMMTRLIRLRNRSSTALALELIAASSPLLIKISHPTDMNASTTARIPLKLTLLKLQELWYFTQMFQNGNF